MREAETALELVDLEQVTREGVGQERDHLLAAIAQRDQTVLVGHGQTVLQRAIKVNRRRP